jgi:hypothetical protein
MPIASHPARPRRSRSCWMAARRCVSRPDSIPERSATSWPSSRTADVELATGRADQPLFRSDRHAKGLRLARPPRGIGPVARSVLEASLVRVERNLRGSICENEPMPTASVERGGARVVSRIRSPEGQLSGFLTDSGRLKAVAGPPVVQDRESGSVQRDLRHECDHSRAALSRLEDVWDLEASPRTRLPRPAVSPSDTAHREVRPLRLRVG